MTYIFFMKEQARTIVYSIENGIFPIPKGNALVFGGYNAELSPHLKQADFVTPLAKDAVLWKKSGHGQAGQNTRYAIAYILAEQQKAARNWQIASALNSLEEGGIIVICAENSQGGKSLLDLQDIFYISIAAVSKNKCRLVWGTKTTSEHMQVACTNALESGAIKQRNDGLWTQPGVFSWEHSDIGSSVLTKYIPPLKGRVADFGCGIGEITFSLFHQSTDIQSATLIDHDARAIACAQKNLSAYGSAVEYMWTDIYDVTLQNQFDFIVMNPPFHTGKMQSVELGLIFIKRAYQALKKGGKLYMVANSHLPYESILSDLFSSHEQLAKENGFKVIMAHK